MIDENLGAKYTVRLEVYEGPLDLLLRLIEREEMDITTVSLARVTDQYLAHLELLQEAEVEDLADFLVVAARLVLIKSRALLPRLGASEGEEEEDVGEDLVAQLQEYRRFKMAADVLREREEMGLRAYPRLVPAPNLEPRLVPGEGDLRALALAMMQVLQSRKPESPVDEVITPVTVTIAEQMTLIQERLRSGEKLHFRELLRSLTYRLEIIVTFLAVLELVRLRRIDVVQEALFGDIVISAVPEGAASSSAG